MNPPTAITYDLISEKTHQMTAYKQQQEAGINYSEKGTDDTSEMAFRFIVSRNKKRTQCGTWR